MINWQVFNSRPVYLTVAVVGLVLIWDFFNRVWYPLDTDFAAEAQQEQRAEYSDFQFGALPSFLDNWIHQAEREAVEQEQVTAQETEEEAERRREAERQRRLRPLDGSTELENVRLRVRAIFKYRDEAGHAQSLALAEQQDVATGGVSRVILRPGEKRGGYVIAEITADAVELTHPTNQEVRLYVFEFN